MMDLRNLPAELNPHERCEERRARIEKELNCSLSAVSIEADKLGHAEEKNCEHMFGAVPIPVGYAGPLNVTFSNGENTIVHLPLATTEGALVASVNRGCKSITQSGGATANSVYHGISRSMCFKVDTNGVQAFIGFIENKTDEWKKVGEQTSEHLKILSSTIDHQDSYVFLTLNCDTDQAMGMNMVTIASEAVGNWIKDNSDSHVKFITAAGNVDSDKKPSKRTHDLGRGYDVTAEVIIKPEVIETVLKSDPKLMIEVTKGKLEIGSDLAGALGKNMHSANVIAALYLATGQDAAHTVEGSLTDTGVEETPDGLKVSVRCPAILVGVHGGGTTLPAQKECLDLILNGKTSLHPCKQLAESIGSAVLAGEVSLLAAQASHHLAKSHEELGR